ncbi:hypothetical protein O3M35_006321 [Rhynocoris fuscipes]|uniref:DUF4780 domain-containing protein n=1 Tax=Rhynocoris fuscipes TaxID=488301 RepID=A0AAW1DEK5_9HEMI
MEDQNRKGPQSMGKEGAKFPKKVSGGVEEQGAQVVRCTCSKQKQEEGVGVGVGQETVPQVQHPVLKEGIQIIEDISLEDSRLKSPSKVEQKETLLGSSKASGEAGTSSKSRKRKKKKKKTSQSTVTLDSVKSDVKKARMDDSKCNLQIAIVRADGEAMMEADADHLREHLVSIMVSDEKRGCGTSEEDWWPEYEESGLVGEGMFLITCLNQRTRDWTIGQPIQPRGDVAYKIIEGEDVPKMIRVSAWIPGKKHTDMAHVFRVLAGQNKGLKTEGWRVLYSAPREKGMWMVLLIDPHSASILEKRDWRPCYELTRIPFKKMDRKGQA